jgi:predicted 3-demethylubiquinone-9 3-methyltransferase (glyoxalase superfamily)
MPTTTPCLWFDTQGEEAAELYCSVFPNSRIRKVTRYGPDMPGPEGQVLTVEFELDGQPFTALNGGPQFTFDEAISFQIDCADQEEADHYWYSLSKGGQESQCGWLKDRFGLSWQVVPRRLVELLDDPDPQRATRAMQAMLTMGRIDIAEVERAADGA